jgi:hypothetical protein
MKLAGSAVVRQLRLKSSPALLTGRIFDDRGNRMSPTHANKLGIRSLLDELVRRAIVRHKQHVGKVHGTWARSCRSRATGWGIEACHRRRSHRRQRPRPTETDCVAGLGGLELK